MARMPRRPGAALVALVAVAGTLTSLVMLAGVDLDAAFAALPVRVRDPQRPFAIAVAADFVLLAWRWRSRGWRSAGLALLLPLAVIGLCLVARQGPPAWPSGDGALIELYTIYASRGQQLTGAYSQFGWHHPGPGLFYVLTPFYVLGGRSVHALNAGALFTNVLCVATIAWVVARRRDRSPVLAIALFLMLLLFVARVPPLLTSAWNPHVPVLPFAALIVTAAASASGDFRLLPACALLASFTAQAHIGLVPAAAAVLAAAFAGAWLAAHDQASRGSMTFWATVSSYVLAAAWLLPIAEQIVHTPGNMTLIARYFFADARPGQPAWAAWGTMTEALTSAFRPGFQAPQGWAFARAAGLPPLVAGTIVVAALPPAVLRGRRYPDAFQRALAAMVLLACLVGFWSVLRIRGSVADHAVFWLSALGVLGVGAAAGGIADAFGGLPRASALHSRVVPAAGVILVAATGLLGYRQLVAGQQRPAARDATTIAVQALSDDTIKTMRQAGISRPELRVPEHWEIAAGMAVQLTKERIPFAVEATKVPLFGWSLSPRGDEDAIFTLAGLSLHEQLSERPGNILVARFRSVFVDGIRVPR